jgi:hypothetical protein
MWKHPTTTSNTVSAPSGESHSPIIIIISSVQRDSAHWTFGPPPGRREYVPPTLILEWGSSMNTLFL